MTTKRWRIVCLAVDCGRYADRERGICSLHDAAPELLKALESVWSKAKACRTAGIRKRFDGPVIEQLIAKAKGASQ